MNYICFDGNLLPADQPVLMADNRGYRYGDGLFETMKVVNGNILLADYHFQRFFDGLELMKMVLPPFFLKEELIKQVIALCKKNNCTRLARVRLSAFGGNGGLSESANPVQYIIGCWSLGEERNQLNKEGFKLGIYTDSQKSCDPFSNLKSANFLPYVMAAKYAKENNLDDCLVTNVYGRIADATIANLFLVNEKGIITPALNEGCINGVMRRHLIEQLYAAGYVVNEQPVTINDVEHADEIFLTNAISGILWVRQVGEKNYNNTLTTKIYRQHIEPLWR